MSVPFMRNTLGVSARLEVSIAWGADLSASPATWTWTEITSDIFGQSKISITVGRGDEASASQPASCGFTVDNRAGAYSLGGQSSNWPNVRRGTPLRVRVDPDGSGLVTRFQGEVVGFTPTFDSTGLDARVQVTAAGTLRRLGQGKTPVLSPYRRSVIDAPDVVAYWPCEEERGAQVFASGLPGGTPMTISGDAEHAFPDFADNKDFACSKPIPQVRQTAWRGVVPTYSSAGTVQVKLLMSFPEASINGTTCVLVTFYTSGTIARTELYYGVGGWIGMRCFGATGASIFDTTLYDFGSDNTIRQWSFSLAQNGANVDYDITALGIGWRVAGGPAGTISTQTVGVATSVAIGPGLDVDDLALGHVSVHNSFSPIYAADQLVHVNAHAGELATDRLARLGTENGVPITITGSSDVLMGPQSVSTLTKLLRECELADGGVLHDGLTSGLSYISRSAIENAAAALTLDASTGDPARELTPVDDDQRTANKVTATRTEGTSSTYEDVDGPMGTAAIGLYDDSLTVSLLSDSDIPDYASRAVGRGTIEGYRYPKLQLDLAAKPALAPAWCDAALGSRIDVTNLSTVRPVLPAGTLSLFVEGYTETIDQFTWDVKINASPFDIWRAGQLVADSGDTSPFPLRATSDGSTLNSSVSLGATSLSVATPSGPLWTTSAGEMPISITVGGVIVTVTAISGTSSPQTFTVNAIPKAMSSGLEVDLYQPVTPTLGNGSPSLPYAVGDTISAAVLRAAIPQISVLPGTRTVSQVIAQTEAAGMELQLQPLARYALEGYIAYESGTTPDIVFALTAPRAVRGHWSVMALNDASGNPGVLRMIVSEDFDDGILPFSGSLSRMAGEVRGYLTTAYEGGPLRLSFSQFTSDASETLVLAGSWLRVTRII